MRVLDDPYTANNGKEVERLILCTGKVAIDLSAALETGAFATNRLAIVRVEQLYPFPQDDLLQVLKRYPRLREVVWVQEEPKNMGAWMYMQPRLQALIHTPLRYIGWPERSSPAEGMADVHEGNQKQIIDKTLNFD
ncbi:hypothetical protein DNHGIG_32750 [Collibacillus ludicampi]|uniref:2-oxoglutarate dehydrogenase E1 component/KDG C-terminal domain-containing protein n=1 Tax=Collibacillus ludicampi TaxID=2771369 RepID=A0AAV4LIQ4_9BACL|nr:hypothetical protein DNHGIG_32750 [Collibacillus ludicampi]